MTKFKKFLEGVIGTNGSNIVEKLCKNDDALASCLLPRTLLAYLKLVSNLENYTGTVPGLDNSSINTLNKTLTIDNELFDAIDPVQTAALLAVQLELDAEPVSTEIDPNKLSVLGKTLDILTKTHFLSIKLAKNEHEQKISPKSLKMLHEGINAVKKGQIVARPFPEPALNKSFKLSLEEMSKFCKLCGQKEFSNNSFVGCRCFASMAKGCKVEKLDTGCKVTFGADWDEEALSSLFKVFKR